MTNTLRTLYKRLIEDQINKRKEWHDQYSKAYDEVNDIRKDIAAGCDLSIEKHKDFLIKLLFATERKDNGVASAGQSFLSKETFNSFIACKEFLSALQAFIVTPNKDEFEKFKNIWRAQNKRNNPLRQNRVAAACTNNVSVAVDNRRFDVVFNWLVEEKVIERPQDTIDHDWFTKNNHLLSEINKIFNSDTTIDKEDPKFDKFYQSIFVWELYEILERPFSLKKQLIKYGAPGTGKTFQAQQQVEYVFDEWKENFAPDAKDFTHISQIERVQFHPSYSYEDFIEGLRPDLDNEAAQLKLVNGIFKKFCIKAGKWEKAVFDLKLDKDWELITVDELRPYYDDKKLLEADWDYIFNGSKARKSELVSDVIPPFFFIIDEVNRAELSRVFGELMYCLEYRGVKGRIKTQYANLNNERTSMLSTDEGHLFFIPTNVYLIGTMNNIDRSVESFDFALRRRFHWEEVKPDINLLRCHLKEFNNDWAALADNLEALNKTIAGQQLLGPDYQIGHAYLMDLKYELSLTVADVRKRVWYNNIKPLLQEYLRGTGKEDELISNFAKEFGISNGKKP